MQISVDISLYPLKDDYIPAIDEFIAKADSAGGIKVVKNTLSTQLYGDINIIMPFLQSAFEESWMKWGQGIFATRFLMGDLAPPTVI
ncbi:MAG: hypothetical protein OEZ23_06275 [Gammaproteobacteria bacterium]|nr:hypothetical protein [Gammaproteobacteria bacterium]